MLRRGQTISLNQKLLGLLIAIICLITLLLYLAQNFDNYVNPLSPADLTYQEGIVARRKTANPCFSLGNGSWACLPHFIVLGAMKAGTTFLYHYLSQHPSIAPMIKKEVFYFNSFYWKGIQWYASHFIYTPGNEKLMGEGTPFYLNHPYVPERLFQTLPGAKLIIILRDPVERLVSQYYHGISWLARQHYTQHNLSLEHMVREEFALLTRCFHPENVQHHASDPYFNTTSWKFYNSCADECRFCFPLNNYGHISGHPGFGLLIKGHYLEQIKEYFKYYKQDQVLILEYEEGFKYPPGMFRKIEEFLELPGFDFDSVDFGYVNHNEKGELPAHLRRWLREYFDPLNQQLYKYLGRRFHWQKPGDPLVENKPHSSENASVVMIKPTAKEPLKPILNPTPLPPAPGTVVWFSSIYNQEQANREKFPGRPGGRAVRPTPN